MYLHIGSKNYKKNFKKNSFFVGLLATDEKNGIRIRIRIGLNPWIWIRIEVIKTGSALKPMRIESIRFHPQKN